MPPRPRLAHPHHGVVAVVVAHDGARWLPETLAAIAAQSRRPQVVVGVDTGSTDASRALLVEALGEDHVTTLPAGTGFGAAVAAGVALATGFAADGPTPRRRASDVDAPEHVRWVWLLHDDCAPEPDALTVLLEAATTMPSAAVLGPKARDWDNPRLLVEVGLTMDRAGRRETGLERRELDQGQHDATRDVLAVGSAGALVRRDVWDTLGYDPRFPLYRDDIDFGWRVNAAGHRVVVVPDAKVRHARAATLGKRPVRAAHGKPSAIDRRHSLAVLLANLPARAALSAAPRLLVGALLRTIGFLLTRQVTAARDEIGAIAWNIAHAGDILKARRERRPHRVAEWSAIKPLFAGRTARLRGYLEAFGDWLTGGGGGVLDLADPDNDEELPPPRHRERLLKARPGLALVGGLVVLAAIAARNLYGSGSLVGGSLLPLAGTPGELWRSYLSSWHAVGAGSETAATPAIAVLAALGWPLGGNVWLVLDLLLLGAVPLAGLSAYLASRSIVDERVPRLWAAVAYALLPVGTGAVAGGRLDDAVAFVAAPPLLLATQRLLGRDPRHAGWRLPFSTGLGLAVAMAFAPQLWIVLALPLAGGALVVLLSATPASRAGAARRIAAAGLAVVTPLAVLVPWSGRVLGDGVLLLAGPSATTRDLTVHARPLELLLLQPGGPAMPPLWVTAGVVLAALAGLLRERRRRLAVAYWSVAIIALVVATLVARGAGSLPRSYPGAALAVAGAAMIACALVAAQGARERLAGFSFGWRQPAAALVAIAAIAGPLVAAGNWALRGAGDPLDRRAVGSLPPAAVSQLEREPGTRVLWLRPDPDPDAVARYHYSLTTAAGPSFADTTLEVPPGSRETLDELVRDVTVARGSNAAEGLATFAVRFIAVPLPVPPDLGAALDAQSGLSRVSFVGDVQLWRTLTPIGRLVVVPAELAPVARAGAFPTRDQVRTTPPAGLPARGDAAVPAGAAGRLLVLSERADDDWVATIGGRELDRVTAWGWAQAFVLPAEGGVVDVRRDHGERHRALVVQGVILLLVVVLAAPSVRRPDDSDPEPPADAETDEHPLEPALAGGGSPTGGHS